MNYLAHICLSGEDSQRQIGNFVADAVKGSSYNKYPLRICQGILLHRAIDCYTDAHPLVIETVKALRPHFGRYSAALLDIYFDYLLASHFNEFSAITLKKRVRKFYWAMIRYRSYLPDRFKRFMWHFIFTNRLGKYATKPGIEEALDLMVGSGRMQISATDAIRYLALHEEELMEVFRSFWTDMQQFVAIWQEENV